MNEDCSLERTFKFNKEIPGAIYVTSSSSEVTCPLQHLLSSASVKVFCFGSSIMAQ